MQKQKVRVMVASEYPEVRYFLKQALEKAGDGVIVGQAPDSVTALALTRNLRPDIALIDSYLPEVSQQGAVPLSRMVGLDIAQAITEEIPGTRVVLLSDLNDKVLPEDAWTPDKVLLFCQNNQGANVCFTLQALYRQTWPLNQPVFANVDVESQILPQQKVSTLSDKAVFFGGLGIAGGWLTTLTIFLAPVGIAIAAIGATSVLLGLGAKLTSGLWRRAQQPGRAVIKS